MAGRLLTAHSLAAFSGLCSYCIACSCCRPSSGQVPQGPLDLFQDLFPVTP